MVDVNPAQYDDEIDLFELIQTLWGYKWLIAGITALSTALGVVYALSITPIFEAEAQLIAPMANDVRQFQVGVSDIEYTPAQAYSRFKSNLESVTLRRMFFDQAIDPFIERNPEHTDFEHFDKNFNQHLSVKADTLTTVALESESPELAAQWVNDLIQFVSELTVSELVDEANQYIVSSLRLIEQDLNARTAAARSLRFERIAQLEEALVIAEAMNLQHPMIENAANQLNMEYMRGARALAAEIDVLRNRESDALFISELEARSDFSATASKTLHSQKTLRSVLEHISYDPSLIRVVRVDQAAEVPTTRKSPNRSLITAVSLVLGGMLGLFAALVLGAIRKRREASL